MHTIGKYRQFASFLSHNMPFYLKFVTHFFYFYILNLDLYLLPLGKNKSEEGEKEQSYAVQLVHTASSLSCHFFPGSQEGRQSVFAERISLWIKQTAGSESNVMRQMAPQSRTSNFKNLPCKLAPSGSKKCAGELGGHKREGKREPEKKYKNILSHTQLDQFCGATLQNVDKIILIQRKMSQNRNCLEEKVNFIE